MKLCKEDLLDYIFKIIKGNYIYYQRKDMADLHNLQVKLEPVILMHWLQIRHQYLNIVSWSGTLWLSIY